MLTFKRDYKKAYSELTHYADEHFCSEIVDSILDANGGNRWDIKEEGESLFY